MYYFYKITKSISIQPRIINLLLMLNSKQNVHSDSGSVDKQNIYLNNFKFFISYIFFCDVSLVLFSYTFVFKVNWQYIIVLIFSSFILLYWQQLVTKFYRHVTRLRLRVFRNKSHSGKSISDWHIATDAEGRQRAGLSTSLFEQSRYRQNS